MIEAWVAAIVFACLFGASLLAMLISPVLPAGHRDDDTANVVRLIANIFVVMTSLVFGLMINSARTTYADIDGKVHGFATSPCRRAFSF